MPACARAVSGFGSLRARSPRTQRTPRRETPRGRCAARCAVKSHRKNPAQASACAAGHGAFAGADNAAHFLQQRAEKKRTKKKRQRRWQKIGMGRVASAVPRPSSTEGRTAAEQRQNNGGRGSAEEWPRCADYGRDGGLRAHACSKRRAMRCGQRTVHGTAPLHAHGQGGTA